MRFEMSRKPFKPESLSADMTFAEFRNWMAQNPHELGDNFNQANLLQGLLRNFAAELGALYRDEPIIDYPIAPSALPKGVRMPAEFFKFCSMIIVMDEFFGIMYQPQRKDKRFEGDILQVLETRLKAKNPTAEAFVNSVFRSVFGGMDTLMLSDLEKLYGRLAVKNWWLNASEDELMKIRRSSLYAQLEQKYGGGLED